MPFKPYFLPFSLIKITKADPDVRRSVKTLFTFVFAVCSALESGTIRYDADALFPHCVG